MSTRDRLFPLLLAACRDAIAQAEKEHLDCQRAADWHNNHTPHVGQHVSYMEADPMPTWVATMKRLLADTNAAEPVNQDPSLPNNVFLSDDDRTRIQESTR